MKDDTAENVVHGSEQQEDINGVHNKGDHGLTDKWPANWKQEFP